MKRVSIDDVKLISEVRKIRKERGVSQSFLANKLGITSQQMHKYEVGTDRLPATYLWKIANALGVNIDTFFSVNIDPSFKEGQNFNKKDDDETPLEKELTNAIRKVIYCIRELSMQCSWDGDNSKMLDGVKKK